MRSTAESTSFLQLEIEGVINSLVWVSGEYFDHVSSYYEKILLHPQPSCFFPQHLISHSVNSAFTIDSHWKFLRVEFSSQRNPINLQRVQFDCPRTKIVCRHWQSTIFHWKLYLFIFIERYIIPWIWNFAHLLDIVTLFICGEPAFHSLQYDGFDWVSPANIIFPLASGVAWAVVARFEERVTGVISRHAEVE